MAKDKTDNIVENINQDECPLFTICRTVVWGETPYEPGQEAELRKVMDSENFFALLELGAIVRA